MGRNQSDGTGCLVPIILLCTFISAIMLFMWIGKGISDFIKENPGGFFVIVTIIAIIGWMWISDKSK